MYQFFLIKSPPLKNIANREGRLAPTVQGNTAPMLFNIVSDEGETAVNLSGYTSFTAKMAINKQTDDGGNVALTGTFAIDDAASGQIIYTPSSSDVATIGEHRVYLSATGTPSFSCFQGLWLIEDDPTITASTPPPASGTFWEIVTTASWASGVNGDDNPALDMYNQLFQFVLGTGFTSLSAKWTVYLTYGTVAGVATYKYEHLGSTARGEWVESFDANTSAPAIGTTVRILPFPYEIIL